MYLVQIIEKYKLSEDNLEEVYDMVCKHLEEVELTKITLEKLIWRKKHEKTNKEEAQIQMSEKNT